MAAIKMVGLRGHVEWRPGVELKHQQILAKLIIRYFAAWLNPQNVTVIPPTSPSYNSQVGRITKTGSAGLTTVKMIAVK